MENIDGIVLPGGESTAMGLIGNATATPDDGQPQLIPSPPQGALTAGRVGRAEPRRRTAKGQGRERITALRSHLLLTERDY